MRNLLDEMGFSLTGPSMLRIDNQSAISVAKHPEHHGRMKQLVEEEHLWHEARRQQMEPEDEEEALHHHFPAPVLSRHPGTLWDG